MSSENDVPLGEEGRRYYERQFGERIRQVSKPGGTPPSGGSNWSGKAGAGIAIGVVFIVIRIILAVARTDSSTPSYTNKPPAPPAFEADFHFRKGMNDGLIQGDGNNIPQPEVPALDALLDKLKAEQELELKDEKPKKEQAKR